MPIFRAYFEAGQSLKIETTTGHYLVIVQREFSTEDVMAKYALVVPPDVHKYGWADAFTLWLEQAGYIKSECIQRWPLRIDTVPSFMHSA